jgi:hypothetical protein
MLGVRYLTAFAIGTVVGVLNELVQKPEQPCYSAHPSYSCALTCGAANVYGWSLLALTAYFDAMGAMHAPTALTLLLIGPVLTLCEAACGYVSLAYFGEQRWKYPESYLPGCSGYVSVVSSLYFAAAGIAYYYGLYRPLLSKI